MWLINWVLVSSLYSTLSPTYPAAQLDSDHCVKFSVCVFSITVMELVQFHIVSSSRSSFCLCAVTFICIYKPCAAKALNRSIVWHTHALFYTLNSRGLEMFVYFCQHLTVIIFNHSHTCLSLKIVLTLPRRLFPVITASKNPVSSPCLPLSP